MDTLKDPRQCSNGHLFCMICIEESLKYRKSCPMCNCAIETLSHNVEIERILSGKLVRCCKIEPVAEDSCPWWGYDKDYDSHRQVCPYREVQCSIPGCSVVVQSRYYLRHLAHCLQRTFSCRFCESKAVPMSQFIHHMSQLCYYRSSSAKRSIPSPMHYPCNKERYDHATRLINPLLKPTVLLTSTHSIKCVAFSANDVYMAHAIGASVPIHNTVTGMLMNTVSISSGPIDCVSWRPCGSIQDDSRNYHLAVASGYVVCILHGLSSRIIAMIISDKKINRVSWSPDGSALVTSGNHNSFSVWNADTGQLIWSQSCEYQVKCIAWSPCGQFIASGCEQIRVWSALSGFLVNLLSSLDVYGPYCLDWSPCSSYLVSTSEAVNIALWDVAHGTVVRILEGHSDNVVSLRWSPDGMYVASCSLDKAVRVWGAHSGVCVSILKGHTEAVLSLAWSDDSDFLLSGSADKQLLLW